MQKGRFCTGVNILQLFYHAKMPQEHKTNKRNTLFSNLKQYGALVSSIRKTSKSSLEKRLLHWQLSKIATLWIKTLCMKTVFNALTTIRGISIIFFLCYRKKNPVKIITNKEDTGLQSMYNLDKTYLKTFL